MEKQLEKIENLPADEPLNQNPMKNNKWNPKDCSPVMNISCDGLIVEQFGEYLGY